MKMKLFGLTETKLFHFHRVFKSWGRGGGLSEPAEPPQDPPLDKYMYQNLMLAHSHLMYSMFPNASLCLLVSYVDNLYKQFKNRSGRTIRRA